MSTIGASTKEQGSGAAGEVAWGCFLEALRTMCALSGTGLGVVHLDEDPPRLEVVEAVGLLAGPEAARADIIQVATASGEASPRAANDPGIAWQVVRWGEARRVVIEASPQGRTIGAWAEREAVRFRELGRSEAALDAVGEGIVVVDAARRVALCTRRAAELLGASGPEAVERKSAREVIAGVVDRLEPHETVRGSLGPDKKVSYVAQHLAPEVGRSDHRPGLVVRLRSEERFSETRRGHLQLLSALRHDVRSPLTALRGLVGVLQEEPDMPREERVPLLELLRQEAERTVTWVEDYLMLLRLRFEPRPQSLTRMAADVPLRTLERHYAQHARERGVSFSVTSPDAAAPHWIQADGSLVDAFCKNLVGHFLRLADAGATIDVRLGDDGALIVEGQGPGLFAQHPAQPFTTLARSTAAGKRTPGVGLGLFLAKKVADVHGWPIAVTAEDGLVRAVVHWADAPAPVTS